MTRIELDELTYHGDCDRCTFGICDECHLQCTHLECDDDDDVIDVEFEVVDDEEFEPEFILGEQFPYDAWFKERSDAE